MGLVEKIQDPIVGTPKFATVLYLDGRPLMAAGEPTRTRRGAESQRSRLNDAAYYANMRGDFETFGGATYAGTVALSELPKIFEE